ncbi:hypothetical protein NEMBOFW57_008304 [Staphylotrichum longicolle]|uniref:Uncharacterized protein n=1 Tax=Staphylotrichum longicolle TaxID=669026 RepID=A0AAD4HVR0_9PEZI|nr:hypothetical protein NEMBOFW57_008304 [Staphylotrichum longicolle]
MHLPHTTVLLAGCGLAAAVAVPDVVGSTRVKRWDYDVCLNDCSLAGIPMPDQNTFGLPLENFYSEQCPPIVVGPYNNPSSASRACFTFSGPALHVDFEPFPGYTIKSAVVTWKVKGNIAADSSTWSSPPPTTNILCSPSSDGHYICDLPFNQVLQKPTTASIPELMAGMCPNGDREGLGFYFQLSGLVEPVGGGAAIPFVQQYPCTSRDGSRQCTSWNTQYPYIEVAYRCTNCQVSACPTSTTPTPTPTPSETSYPPTEPSTTSCSTTSTTSSAPPSLKTCGFGTAFGYQNPVAGVQKSTTLNTQSGAGCNRWGWYETPTVAELQGGMSGPLYVGAGGNDITKAMDVGIWVATANAQGRVTVTYLLNPPYALAEVHVNLQCLPLTKCAPGQYTYNAGAIPNLPTWSNPTPLVYPTCTGGSKAALIIHAAVNILSVVPTCPPPKAT